jgi:hypothetical protein
MSRHLFACVVIALASHLAASCSDQLPVTPTGAAAETGNLSARAEKTPGIYELSLLNGQDRSNVAGGTLPVVTGALILQARVRESSEVPAVTGTVIWESCALRGANAPAATCDSGPGRWRRVVAQEVASVGAFAGMASYLFEPLNTPQTVGFRFRYVRGDVVADGVGGPGDVTWVEN